MVDVDAYRRATGLFRTGIGLGKGKNEVYVY